MNHLRPARPRPRRRPLEPRYEWRLWAWERSRALEAAKAASSKARGPTLPNEQLELEEKAA
jgi:hypothetical protein